MVIEGLIYPGEVGEPSSVPAPPGTDIPQSGAVLLFGDLPQVLGLRSRGVVTPWAMRSADMSWQVVQQPMPVNVQMYGLSDKSLSKAVESVTFGSLVPYVAVLSKKPTTTLKANAAFDGCAYHFYETQACYRQDDSREPPDVWFLHWVEALDIPPRRSKSLVKAAAELDGVLVYAAQVPRAGTTRRTHPTYPFKEAFEAQLRRTTPLEGKIVAMTPPVNEAAAGLGAVEAMPSGLKVAAWTGIGVGIGFWILRQWRRR